MIAGSGPGPYMTNPAGKRFVSGVSGTTPMPPCTAKVRLQCDQCFVSRETLRMICSQLRCEVFASKRNSRINCTPVASSGWLVRRTARGPIASAAHRPDHSFSRRGIICSGPMSKRPALDGVCGPPGVPHFTSCGSR